MHIIQVQTIDAWKGPQEWPRKPCLCHLVNSHGFYKEWTDISMKCVAIVNPKCLFVGSSTTEKSNKCLKTWRLEWCHGMTSPCPGKNLRRLAYVVMHALHKSNHHQGSFMVSRGKSLRLKGDPTFLCPLSTSFVSMMSIQPANHRVQIWHFSGFICHI